jgi:DedD protein
MNEQIKRRLIGIVALALAAILPEPRLQPTPDEDLRIVTIPLQEDAIATVPAQSDALTQLAPPDDAAPPQIDGDGAVGVEPDPFPSAMPTQRPTPRATPRPTSSPVASATPRPAALPTPAATLKLSPTLGPIPAPRPAATPTPTPRPVVPTASAWWVQIGSYADIGNARDTEARVAALGQPAVMAPIEAAGTTLYRVRAGPYATEARAQEAHALITRTLAPEARIIKP